MRRVVFLTFVLLLAGAGPALFAQEPAGKPAERSAETNGESGGLVVWKWVNFAILAGGLGYVIKKNAGPYFAARTRQIKKDMIEAEDLREQADARVADVERRLAGLEADIARMREESQREAQAEGERLSRYTAAEMAKIQAHTQQGIEAATKAARMELKRYSAELAIALAEQKIRARMTPEAQESLIRGFVRHLEPSADARNA